MPGKIGFFDLQVTKDKRGYIGALLVVDEFGKPEEFRVTYPVKPTLVQRQLYGASLEPHIGVVLCGRPLYTELRTRQDIEIIVLANEQYLNLASYVTCRVVKLERAGEQISVAAENESKSAEIYSERPGFAPVAAVYPSTYSRAEMEASHGVLERYFANFDLLEPFERIAKAVAALAESDSRFQ